MATLEATYNVKVPHQSILNAYLHFEAMTAHQYSYSCLRCGIYPPVLIMDLNKKTAFRLAGKFHFFNKLEQIDLYFISVSDLTFWAPWIGRNVRNSEIVLNTEHRKCHREEDENELGNLEISEDRLIELLHGNKV